MMALKQNTGRLIDRLPVLRGRITEGADLSAVTWFRVGGPAEILFKPADSEDLAALLSALPDANIMVLGVGSNLLVRDGGFAGIVVRLGRGFAEIKVEGQKVIAGAGALDLNLAKTAQLAGLTGLEFFCGIPGTIGGALRMNAGAYGRETKDVLLWAEAMDRSGAVHRLEPGALGYSYRHCGLPEDWIFLKAAFRAETGKPEDIAARMAEIQAARGSTQPIRSRTGGSTFKNPQGKKAWQLIDAAGGRGLTRGGAQVSEQHCNFLINTGAASAADIEGLGEELRRRVKEKSGLELEWEIKRVGHSMEARS